MPLADQADVATSSLTKLGGWRKSVLHGYLCESPNIGRERQTFERVDRYYNHILTFRLKESKANVRS